MAKLIEIYRGCQIYAHKWKKRGKRKKGAIFPWYQENYSSPCAARKYGQIGNLRAAIDREKFGATRAEAPHETYTAGGAAANLAFLAEAKRKEAAALAASQVELERVRAGWLGEEEKAALTAEEMAAYRKGRLALVSTTKTVENGWARAEEVKRVVQEPLQTRAAVQAEKERLRKARERQARLAKLEQEAAKKYRARVTPLTEREVELRKERGVEVGGRELREMTEEQLAEEGYTPEEMVTPGEYVLPGEREPWEVPVVTPPRGEWMPGAVVPVQPVKPLVSGLDFAVDTAVKRLLFLGVIASIVKALVRP